MPLDRTSVLALARTHVSDDEWRGCVVSWDATLRLRGADVAFGPVGHPMPFDGVVVFVDLQPEANWSHPARAVFIRADGGETHAFDVRFPPGTAPGASFQILRTCTSPD